MENNIINLVDVIAQKKEVQTFQNEHVAPLKIEDEKISQRRIYSFIVDFTSILLINTCIQTAYAVSINEFLYSVNLQARMDLFSQSLPFQVGVFLLTYCAYFFYSLYVMDGQTFGKKVFKLHAVKDSYIFNESESETLSLTDSFRRTMGYLGCYLSFGSFFVFSMMSEDKRGLPDYFSSSRTVSEEWLVSNKFYRSIDPEQVQIDVDSLSMAQNSVA